MNLIISAFPGIGILPKKKYLTEVEGKRGTFCNTYLTLVLSVFDLGVRFH